MSIKMDKVKDSGHLSKIMDIFLDNPEREYHVREIAKLFNISPSTASKYLDELKKEPTAFAKFITELENEPD